MSAARWRSWRVRRDSCLCSFACQRLLPPKEISWQVTLLAKLIGRRNRPFRHATTTLLPEECREVGEIVHCLRSKRVNQDYCSDSAVHLGIENCGHGSMKQLIPKSAIRAYLFREMLGQKLKPMQSRSARICRHRLVLLITADPSPYTRTERLIRLTFYRDNNCVAFSVAPIRHEISRRWSNPSVEENWLLGQAKIDRNPTED